MFGFNKTTVVLRESGYDTGMSYEDAEKLVREAGYPAPSDLGYDPDECDWFGRDYTVAVLESQWEAELYWLHRG